VNKEIFIDILLRLRDAARRNPPEKCSTNIWFLHHDNAPAHRSVWVKDFLVKYKATTLEHPPYSHDLPPAYFYTFSRLKLAFKGQRFCDATDIIKNATEELKRLSQNGFQECFQHFSSRWQKCIVAQGNNFEGKVA
jgi:transposase